MDLPKPLLIEMMMKVTHEISFNSMFEYATYFNSEIRNWDVSKVTDMTYIFQIQSHLMMT